MKDPIRPGLLSIEQAAGYLGVSPKMGPKAPNPFPVRPKRIGRRVQFDVRDLENYVDALPYDGNEAI
jgi:hypothetical protein